MKDKDKGTGIILEPKGPPCNLHSRNPGAFSKLWALPPQSLRELEEDLQGFPKPFFFQMEKLRLRRKVTCLQLAASEGGRTTPYLTTVPYFFPPNDAESQRNSGFKRT